MRFLPILLVLTLLSCGGDSSSGPPKPTDSPNTPSPQLVEMNQTAPRTHALASELAELVLGEDGIADKSRFIKTAPLSSASDVRAWLQAREDLREQVEIGTQKSATFALEVNALYLARKAFLDQQAIDFPWTPDTTNPAGLTQVRQALILTTLAVATLSIGAYRFLKGFGELADNTQRMVYTTANGNETSRKAVIEILQEAGVDIGESASSEQVVEAFKELPRNVRRSVTTKVEAWNEGNFFSSNEDMAAEVTDRFQEARDDVPDISNEGGAFAVTQTVSLVQAVTGGVGGIEGGVPGAVADLVLTATEMNPTDIVQRQVTVYATSEEKQPLPTETSPTPPSEAKVVLERAAGGEEVISPEAIEDAAIALMQEVADALRVQFGPTIQLAERIALVSATLDETKVDEGSFTQDKTLKLPNFENGDVVEVFVARDEKLPQEVPAHVLGPQNPIELDSPPLLGTLTVQSEPSGGATIEGSQFFNITVNVSRVPNPTFILCQGTNISCQSSRAPIASEGTVTFSAEVFGTAQLRIVRHDTGESYTAILKSAQAPDPEPVETCEEAKAHLCEKLPQVFCDIEVMDTARARVTAACGEVEANRFFAEAPSICC